MRKSPKLYPAVQERAVRMAFDAKDQYPSQWAAQSQISKKRSDDLSSAQLQGR